MKNLRKQVLLIQLILAGVMLAACSEDPATAIIGEWKGETLKQDFHFYSDGRTVLTDHKLGRHEGICFVHENRLLCEFQRFAYPVERTVKISGNKMVMTNKSGNEEIYKRKL